MSNERNIVVLKGVKTEYFRLQGKPHPNYNKDGTEWSSNFILNKTHLKQLKEAGCGRAYIKKNDDGEQYFKFTKRGELQDGSEGKPPTVNDRFRKPWAPNVLVGNGSTADIVVTFNEMSRGPNKGELKPFVLETAVKELVEYNVEGGIDYDSEYEEETTDTASDKTEPAEAPDFDDEDEWEDA
tara:strand:- start:20 stop:568 length:549 start_codon:yes stop_codon:yes gene_type:complete